MRHHHDILKVLQVTKKIPFPLHDGEAWAVRAIAKGLKSAGYAIDLFTIDPDHFSGQGDRIDGLKRDNVYDEIYTCEVDTRPTVIGGAINLFKNTSYHEERFNKRHVAQQALSLFQNVHYDYIIAESVYTMLFLQKVKTQFPNVTIILRAHNAEFRIWERYAERLVGIKRWYYKRQANRLRQFEAKALEMASAVLTVSSIDQEALQLKGTHNTPSLVVPIGIECSEEPRLNDDNTPFIIGFIGSLDWRPNQEGLDYFLQKIWPKVLDLDEEIILMIAGKNPKNIDKYKRIEGVAFLGEIEESAKFISQLDVMVIPLWSGSGTRVKLLQSLSVGTPVISTAIGAEGLTIRDRDEFLLANSIKDWIDTLKLVMQSEDLRLKLETNGKKYLREHHDINTLGHGIKQYFQNL